ncbi:MAG: hypothetical protein IKG47_06190 [Oscillospiraceae bacterium]|nr:hypothetical protein [Oscillospiraceae bacterium]
MDVVNGMSGKQLRDWRKNNRRSSSEETRLLTEVAITKTLSVEDKQLLSDVIKACFVRKKTEADNCPAPYTSEG